MITKTKLNLCLQCKLKCKQTFGRVLSCREYEPKIGFLPGKKLRKKLNI